MNRLQLAVLFGCVLLITGLYLGGRTHPHKKQMAGRNEIPVLSTVDVLQKAREHADSSMLAQVSSLDAQSAVGGDPGKQLSLWEVLSQLWADKNEYAASAVYSRKIAEVDPKEQNWANAGAIFSLGFSREADMGVKAYCAHQAIECYDKAMTVNPANLDYKASKALVLMDMNSVDPSVMPMQGISLLLEVVNQDPENVLAQMSLAQGAIRTGQYAKAFPRLEKVTQMKNANKSAKMEAWYLMAQAYRADGNTEKANQAYDKAISMADTPELKTQLEMEKNSPAQ